jgi:hypothetical protein
LANFKIQPSTWLGTERHSTSNKLNLQPTQLSQPAPQQPNATNAAACRAQKTYKMVLNIMCNQYAAAIDDIYYAILDDPTGELNAINLHSLLIHILTTYAQISQPDLDDNMTNFHSDINSGLLLTIYTMKQEKCQIFAANAGIPISDKTTITTGTKHTLACGSMTSAWRKWKRSLVTTTHGPAGRPIELLTLPKQVTSIA